MILLLGIKRSSNSSIINILLNTSYLLLSYFELNMLIVFIKDTKDQHGFITF